MIGTVNLSMTILAATIQDTFIGACAADQIRDREQIIWMTAVAVTLLTQKWPGRDQQHLMVGPMWQMAVQAVVAYRRMLPDEWTAFFGVTLVAHLVGGVAFQQRMGDGAVGRMTVDTGKLPFQERHM